MSIAASPDTSRRYTGARLAKKRRPAKQADRLPPPPQEALPEPMDPPPPPAPVLEETGHATHSPEPALGTTKTPPAPVVDSAKPMHLPPPADSAILSAPNTLSADEADAAALPEPPPPEPAASRSGRTSSLRFVVTGLVVLGLLAGAVTYAGMIRKNRQQKRKAAVEKLLPPQGGPGASALAQSEGSNEVQGENPASLRSKAGKKGDASSASSGAGALMTHKTGSTTVYPPGHWTGDRCSQTSQEQEAAKPVESAIQALASASLAPEQVQPIDWEGLEAFVKALLRPVPRKPRWAHSLRAFRNARIRYSPSPKADEVGMLAINTRLPPWGWVAGKGCRGGWIAVGPHAYICRRHLVWDKGAPLAQHQPPMPPDQITPGQYAYVRAAGAPLYPSRKAAKENKPSRTLPMGFFVRFKRFCRINGKNYWKTTKNWYVPVSRLARHVPSQFAGVDLRKTGLELPVAFTLRKKRVYSGPGGRVVGNLPRHAAVQVLGTLKRHGRRYYRIGPCRWIRATGSRAAWPSVPPPGTTEHQQWVDVNLARQTLVAYEGKTPVFATMVSTGLDEHPTKHGIFRVYWKVAETDMTNEMGAAEEYMAESVPWSMFFWKGQALHGAYWHDFFGVQRSHGCVNLAPRDARYVYEWSNPHLPDGWIYRWLGVKYPGLLVRIRRRDGDLVRFLGLARKFAPEAAVKARDEEYKKRIEAETLEMLAKARQDQDGAQGTDDKTASTRNASSKARRTAARRTTAVHVKPGRTRPAATGH